MGFPATPIIEARARLCLSAAHTKEVLDQVSSLDLALTADFRSLKMLLYIHKVVGIIKGCSTSVKSFEHVRNL